MSFNTEQTASATPPVTPKFLACLELSLSNFSSSHSSILIFLFEAGFFSNREEIVKIMSDEQVEFMAEELSDSIVDILNEEGI